MPDISDFAENSARSRHSGANHRIGNFSFFVAKFFPLFSCKIECKRGIVRGKMDEPILSTTYRYSSWLSHIRRWHRLPHRTCQFPGFHENAQTEIGYLNKDNGKKNKQENLNPEAEARFKLKL